jgi:hypothetical protein
MGRVVAGDISTVAGEQIPTGPLQRTLVLFPTFYIEKIFLKSSVGFFSYGYSIILPYNISLACFYRFFYSYVSTSFYAPFLLILIIAGSIFLAIKQPRV